MKTTLAILFLLGAGLWYFERRTHTDFTRTAEAKAAGGHSILKVDEPKPVTIVGSFVNHDDNNERQQMLHARVEDCALADPGCFSGERFVVIYHPDLEQVRMRPPFYRAVHYYVATSEMVREDTGERIPILYYGTLADAKRSR